jgi:3-phenylpropionate/trans-cinnamate dioxygenase ferredoxin subunit
VEFVRIGSLAEVPEAEMRAYDVAAGRVAITHIEYRLFAFGDECTHAGCSLSEGKLDEHAATVTCLCHESVFDIETGEPIEGPAQDPLPIYAARDVDGWIEIASEPRAPQG